MKISKFFKVDHFVIFVYDFSPSNGQNIVQLLFKSVQMWCPGRERFECLVHELDGSIEVAVRKSNRFSFILNIFVIIYFRVVF